MRKTDLDTINYYYIIIKLKICGGNESTLTDINKSLIIIVLTLVRWKEKATLLGIEHRI